MRRGFLLTLAGKFTDVLPDGHGAHLGGHTYVDHVSTHAPPGAIIVPDAHLLFTGDFKRAGVDLILSGDGRELVLHDYFKGEKRAALASSDGAHLTGDIVNALTGYTQLAQADGTPSVAQVIGHVTKLVGTATAIRNGVSIILNNGDNVNKGDVVQSGSDSTLGITFIDGSVFGLGSNAKMVLNEMIYDPNGSSNSSLISLVQGTISFVAGATAKKGDMKVDTPVATMGIRGTAVLVEIDFVVPGQGGAPPAKFQVLVEPDGTTGSYILFDKTTLTPIATVNQAGTQTIVNGQGTVNFLSSVQLSPDAQKIISDVFALKFTDLTNPKSNTNFTNTIVPETVFVKLANGDTVPVTVKVAQVADTSGSATGGSGAKSGDHIPGPPDVVTTSAAFTERTGLTGSSTNDTLTGEIRYADINAGDTPTAQATFDTFKYENAQHNDVTASLTAEQIAAIKAVEVPLAVVQDPSSKNTGVATWTYTVPDGAFDFLAAGETLTLTYLARVDNNFALNNEVTFKTFTITITGTNDAPTVATSGGTVTERIGTGNTAIDTISGTVTFTDADLTDRPVVSAALSTTEPFRYLDAQGHNVTAGLTAAQLAAIAAVEVPLSVVHGAGNTHNGSATWTYSIADHAFDFIAKGETLVLNYVIQVSDGHGGVVATPVSISINGADVTVVGTNDTPTITSGLQIGTIGELVNTHDSPDLDHAYGTIKFADVDLTDTHHVTITDVDASGTKTGLAGHAAQLGWLSLDTFADTTGGVTGSQKWMFSASDKFFDYLAVGESVTLDYTVEIDDLHGGIATEHVAVTVNGSNDAPVVVADSNLHTIPERADTTGDVLTPDTASGSLAFTDVDLSNTHSVDNVLSSAVWSGGVTLPGGLAAVLGKALSTSIATDSTGTGAGSVGFTFSAADNNFDFLADGETLTITYNVTVTDNLVQSTQPVVITITGSNDAPVVVADSNLHTIPELVDTTGDVLTPDTASGSLAFTDVDLTDTHSVGNVLSSAIWSGGATLPGGLAAVLGTALSTSIDFDSTGTGAGSVGFTFSAADNNFDFLADGESLTITYNVTVTDNLVQSTQPVVITITGANDAPVLAVDVSGTDDAGLHTIPELGDTTGDILTPDTASGSLAFTDVDLTDTHSVGNVLSSAIWSGGTTLPAGLTAALTKALSTSIAVDSTGIGAGSVGFTFSAADNNFDFLADGESLTITYNVTVTDNLAQSTQPVVITITGSNDAPVVVADSNLHTIPERADTTGDVLTPDTASGSLAFTDVDLSNTHSVDNVLSSAVWSGGATLPAGLTEALTKALSTSIALDSTGTGAGSVGFTFSAADNNFDFLADGETLTITYNVTVTDNLAQSTQPVIITITGANDAPLVAATLSNNADEGDAAFSVNLLTDASDVDHGATLSVATLSYTVNDEPSSTTLPAGISVNGHTLTVDPTNPAFDHLAVGEHATILVSYNVTDAQGATVAQTETVTINGTNDAPTATAPATHYSATAQTDLSLRNTGLSVNDVDGGSSIETVTLAAGEGIITVAAGDSGVTDIVGSRTGSVTFTGTIAQINALLNTSTGTVVYNDNAATPGTSTALTLTIHDNGVGDLSGSANSTIDVARASAANDAPVLSFTTIDDPGATATYAYGINNKGQIVGGATANPNNEVGWEYGTGGFALIGVEGAQDNTAHAINNFDMVAGDYSPYRSTPRYGFVETNGSYSTIASDSPYPSTNANGIDDAGVVVGSDYLHTGARYSGYIDDHGAITYLNAPAAANPSGDTFANGINNHGLVVGSYNPDASVSSGYQGFLYNGSTYTTIADPLGVNGTFAQGINDSGAIVGWFIDANNKQHGFIDNGGVFTTVDDPLGANGTVLNGINDAGAMVGYYIDANHVTHGFVADPTVTITVRDSGGLDFHNDNPLKEMGAGTVQPGGSSTTFTIVDAAAHHEFVVDGSYFTYGGDGAVTGGTITSFHEFTTDSTPVALADFTGLSVGAVTWMNAVQQAAAGDKSAAEALTGNFAYIFNGGSGNDAFGSAGHADTLNGGAGNDTLDPGGAPSDNHDTVTGGAGSDTLIYQQGYGAVTVTDFDQGNSGTFDRNEGDHIQLNGLTAPLRVSYASGNAILDFGNNDVVTLLNVTQLQYEALDGSEFTSGDGNNGGGNNGNGPVLSNAGNSVTYTGTPVLLDPSIAVTDATGTVSSVNVWISSGFQSGDTFSINGTGDGVLTYLDGTIHYHFDNATDPDNPSIFLSAFAGTPSSGDFDAALQTIQFSPGAPGGDRTVTWAAYDNVLHSPTVTTTVHVPTGVNYAPVFGGHDLAAIYHNGDPAVAPTDHVTASDIDSANYAGGSLTATVIGGRHPGDTLSVVDGQYITVDSGTIVMFDTNGAVPDGLVQIGTLSHDGNNDVTVALNGNADDAAVAALTESIKFSNSTENSIADTRTVAFTLHDGGGTANGGHDSSYFTAHVTIDQAPVISIDQLLVGVDGNGNTTISRLSVTDADATPSETFTISAMTAGAASGTSVTPASGSGLLANVNATLQSVTYHPGATPTATDKVAVTVTDGHGAADTLNFIFNVADAPVTPVTLVGTTGKDVFFGTGYQDQFVFAANFNHDTIMNFTHGQDRIDLSAVVTTSDATAWFNQHVAVSPTNSQDTLVTVDTADTIVLRGVTNLSANDFILHVT
jgi:VCBS repeat-containing protein